MSYLKLPLQLHKSIEGKKLDTTNIGESISQFIYILLHTRKGELQSDPNFGSKIWDSTFSLYMNKRNWEYEISKEMAENITLYEKRIRDVSVNVLLTDVENRYALKKYPEARIKADLYVKAYLVSNDELFQFNTTLYLSPIANA